MRVSARAISGAPSTRCACVRALRRGRGHRCAGASSGDLLPRLTGRVLKECLSAATLPRGRPRPSPRPRCGMRHVRPGGRGARRSSPGCHVIRRRAPGDDVLFVLGSVPDLGHRPAAPRCRTRGWLLRAAVGLVARRGPAGERRLVPRLVRRHLASCSLVGGLYAADRARHAAGRPASSSTRSSSPRFLLLAIPATRAFAGGPAVRCWVWRAGALFAGPRRRSGGCRSTRVVAGTLDRAVSP